MSINSNQNHAGPLKAVCGFCGNPQFKYDRCEGCGGTSVKLIDLSLPGDEKTKEILLEQNVKTQNYMNIIGLALTVGVLFMAYSVFKPFDKTPDSSANLVTTQKEYLVLELPSEPVKVITPDISKFGMSSSIGRTSSKPKEPTVPDTCRFDSIDLSDDFVVFAGRSGGKKLSYQINGEGKVAHTVDVQVNHTKKPAILMLDAVAPTIWNIKRTAGTKIKAVFFNGNNHQVIAGMDDSLPIFDNTYRNDYPCGRFKIKKEHHNVVDRISTALFGVAVEPMGKENRQELKFGGPVSYTHQFITDGVSVESYRDKGKLLAGKAGIDQAVIAGLLRPATKSDTDRWLNAAKRNGYDLKDLKSLESMFQYDAYLVLKPFSYPPGNTRVNYFVEKGVPVPEGDPGHSDVYDLNTGTCFSTVCRLRLGAW